MYLKSHLRPIEQVIPMNQWEDIDSAIYGEAHIVNHDMCCVMPLIS